MRILSHCALVLFCLLAIHQVLGATASSSSHPDPISEPSRIQFLLAYVLPFVAYYIGILVRYYAKFLHDSTPPPLREQLVAGIVFSVVAVAPLLPSIRLAVTPESIHLIPYMLIVVVIMQEGLVLHERAVAGVRKLVRRDERPPAA